MKNKNPVIHFEMPSKNIGRMEKFYGEVFGWEAKKLGDQYGNYVLAITTDLDEKTRMPIEPGTINGGFFPVFEDMPAQYPLIVIRVDDILKAVLDIEKAGGKINVKPMEIPEMGMYASFYDTEGNQVSMFQPSEKKEKTGMEEHLETEKGK